MAYHKMKLKFIVEVYVYYFSNEKGPVKKTKSTA